MSRLHISLLLAALVGFAVPAISVAAGNDTLYPKQLLANKPALAQQYAALVKPILGDHGWAAADKGQQTPVTRVSFGGNQYAVLASCKPNDCAEQSVVVLMQPGAQQAVGALVVNHGDQGLGPKSSDITWLGQPGQNQRRFMAAYLFR